MTLSLVSGLILLQTYGPTGFNERLALDNDVALKREMVAAFHEAYLQYPEIPQGLLEAIAFVQTRWSQPESSQEDHNHQPSALGVMGLYRESPGFEPTLEWAAQAYGVDPETLIESPRLCILATAALADHLIYNNGLAGQDLEAMGPVLAELSGIQGKGEISEYAKTSFIYDALLALDRGYDDHGIAINQRNIAWEQVFSADQLSKLRVPLIHMDLDRDEIEFPGYEREPQSETLVPLEGASNLSKSTDYGPALWVASPYFGTRGTSIRTVSIHTMQGSYAGTINWFKSNPYSVSAHYLVRSSDGQITQMVREANRANHTYAHNAYTLGIEHEGYINNAAWYTSAMYAASAALVRHFCQRYGIDPQSCYGGPASSGINVLSDSVHIKGHQHFSNNTHTDPGINWNWASYKNLIVGSTSQTTLLDSFESSEGHFNTSPAYSGSTQGISSTSTADRTTSLKHAGSYSEQIMLKDNPNTQANWEVRFLSGSGSPGANVPLAKAGGRVGFWIFSGGSGLSAAVGVDDSDGTERSIAKSIPANQWTYLGWKLDDSAEWNAWVGGNGIITASSVTLDAIWFFRAETSYTVYLYLDDVTYRRE
ncbi:MAG: N-acetylmuramoyl-L-alanine amidase [Acidobacteria bacterium]|nr:N-acetylmuramoyl-L-alanine amidase [Acidobacteriota bacterium]